MNPIKFNSGNPPLTREEENSLRYMASLMKLNGDEDDEERGTEDWTNALDRGGLWHVSDTAYNLFYAIEEEVQQHLLQTHLLKGPE